jgi:hypothetical protein
MTRKPGKRIASKTYVHRSCADILPQDDLIEALGFAILNTNERFEYDVICWDSKTGSFTFTKCDDFNEEPEPTIIKQVVVNDGKVKTISQPKDPRVFHHKWMFVRDDYHGFDVEKSKKRSEWWEKIPGLDKSRIGSKSFWNKTLASYKNEII